MQNIFKTTYRNFVLKPATNRINHLGLALSLFACQSRIKEIGIRKVNGAKVTEVITMLNKDFVKWVAIAFVIASPIAWYAMNKWLGDFAYKTEMSWWIFYTGRTTGVGNCVADGRLAKLEGCYKKSGGSAEV